MRQNPEDSTYHCFPRVFYAANSTLLLNLYFYLTFIQKETQTLNRLTVWNTQQSQVSIEAYYDCAEFMHQ